jgi:hypothetical protein
MHEVVEWVAANIPFDRVYFYGPDRPIHVSYSSTPKGEIVDMRKIGSGRYVPLRRVCPSP